MLYCIGRFLGKKVFEKTKKVARAEYSIKKLLWLLTYLTVPGCAKGRGTLLLAYTNDSKPKTGCAKCARGFFYF